MKVKSLPIKSLPRIENNMDWIDQLFTVEELAAEQAISIVKQSHRPYHIDFAIQKLARLNNFVIKRYNGAIYYGGVKDSLRNGKGILIYQNKRIHEGNWVADRREGFGLEQFPNKNRYEGSYSKGKPQGHGLYIWATNEVYDGQWFNGMKHGSGVWRGTKGDSYIGEWKNGFADGYGVHIWVNGDRYEGQFHQNLKSGQGKECFANGDTYVGQYLEGKPDGYGEYFWKNGTMYKGNFKCGLRNGFGIWTKFLNKQRNEFEQYRGMYLNDQKSGIGIYQWPNGNLYKGEYLSDNRNGLGTMIWSDGSVYKGEWKKGIQSGLGHLTVQHQQPIFGNFEQSQIVDIIKDQEKSSELESRLNQILQQADEFGSEHTQPPTNTLTSAQYQSIKEGEINDHLQEINRNMIKMNQTTSKQGITSGSSFHVNIGNNDLYDRLKIKLHSHQLSRHPSSLQSPFDRISFKNQQSPQERKIKEKSHKQIKIRPYIKRKVNDIKAAYSYDPLQQQSSEQAQLQPQIYYQTQGETAEYFYSSIYDKTKSKFNVQSLSHQIKDQTFSLNRTRYNDMGYLNHQNISKSTDKSERSTGDVQKLGDRNRRMQTQPLKSKNWIPSGSFKREPENPYLSA